MNWTSKIAALTVLPAMTLPAPAQIRGPSIEGVRWPAPRPGLPGIARDLRQADAGIHDGRRSGQLSRREARALERESRQIAVLQERFARDGLSAAEQAELSQRVAALRSVTGAQRAR